MFDNLLVEKYRPKRIVDYCLKLGNPIEELINSSKKEKIINPIYISDNKILNYKIDKNI